MKDMIHTREIFVGLVDNLMEKLEGFEPSYIEQKNAKDILYTELKNLKLSVKGIQALHINY